MHGDTELTVAFASRAPTSSERNYSIVEKEALACVWAAERCRTYLWGRHFTLRTDHSPLTTLLSTKGFGWSAHLMWFNSSVEYRPGRKNVVADCLSEQRLRELYWWPGMDADVEAAVKSCVTCSQHDKTARTRAAPLQLVALPNAAWKRTCYGYSGYISLCST